MHLVKEQIFLHFTGQDKLSIENTLLVDSMIMSGNMKSLAYFVHLRWLVAVNRVTCQHPK